MTNKMADLGVRPGGLMVQKRSSDRVVENSIKAKHGSYHDHENYVSPRSSFGKTTFNNSKYVHINKGVSKVALEAIAKISLDVNNISKLVSDMESEVSGGKIVSEKAIMNLVELLMVQLFKLDEIVANEEAKLRRKEQVKRVQRYIEDLDMLKLKNARNEITKTIKPIRKPLIYFS